MDVNIEKLRMQESSLTSAEFGDVYWVFTKSVWYISHLILAAIASIYYFSWSAVLVFSIFSAVTLCFGHSLGMHRRLIHNSYECPLWLEYIFVYCGVLVGMAGPYGMLYQHDLRDWAQRKQQCHPYLRHGKSIWVDAWWQLHCDIRLDQEPEFVLEKHIKQDRFYHFLEKTWMWHQVPWAILLFILGGMPWLVWGISMRIVVSITGHWFVGYFAHNQGQRDWHVQGAAVQGYNVGIAAYLTMGESWHNNHHAYPGSARLGLLNGQADPGWWVLCMLKRLGLVWNIKLPEDLPARKELQCLAKNSEH